MNFNTDFMDNITIPILHSKTLPNNIHVFKIRLDGVFSRELHLPKQFGGGLEPNWGKGLLVAEN